MNNLNVHVAVAVRRPLNLDLLIKKLKLQNLAKIKNVNSGHAAPFSSTFEWGRLDCAPRSCIRLGPRG